MASGKMSTPGLVGLDLFLCNLSCSNSDDFQKQKYFLHLEISPQLCQKISHGKIHF